MEFKKTVLQNGLRIITAPQPGNLAVTVLVLVEAGSKYETTDEGVYNRGVSHFLEHMCFKGTAKRANSKIISADLDSLGASYNAFTGVEYTGYYAKARSKDFDKILDIVSDIYLNPVFNEKEIEKERGVVIEEINMYEDDPQHKVADIFMELMYGDSPAGWTISGSKDDIRRLQRNNLLDYRKNHYVSSATVVVVAGSFDEGKAIKTIEEYFKDIPNDPKAPKTKTAEKQSEPRVAIKHRDSDQTHIVLGVRAFDIFDKRRSALDILGAILGAGMSSRLFQSLRDKLGAAYYVSSGADFFSDHGYLGISAGIDKAKIPEVLAGIMEELKDLRDNLVSVEEFEKVKNHITGGMVLSLETSNRLATYYGLQELIERHILTPEEAIKEINMVTREEVQSVARDILKNENLNLAILGPIKEDADLKNLLTLS